MFEREHDRPRRRGRSFAVLVTAIVAALTASVLSLVSSPAAAAATPVNLTLTKTNPSSVIAGQAAQYVLTVTNTGGTTSYAGLGLGLHPAATVVDQLPANLAYNSVNGTGWSCDTSGNVSSGQTLTCSLNQNLEGGASSSFTVSVTPTAAALGNTIRNVAAVDPAGTTNPPNPSTCSADGSPAGCAYPPAQTVTSRALTCTQGDIYVLDGDHDIYLADPTSGNETFAGNVSAATGVTTNALGITNKTGIAYALSGQQSSGTNNPPNVYAYNPATGKTTTYTGPTLGSTPGSIVAGAVDPLNNVYYFGYVTYANNVATLNVYGFDTATNKAINGQIASVTLAGISTASVNGDFVFDRLGRLYLLATTGGGNNTSNELLAADTVLGTSASNVAVGSKVISYLKPNNATFNGMAFDLPTGLLYVTGRSTNNNTTTSFIEEINPSSGAQTANYTLNSSADQVTDAASCNYNNSAQVQASIVDRAAPGDQFTVSVSGGGLVNPVTGVTSGNSTGVQTAGSATAGPVVTVPTKTYTVSESAAGTTSLSNYTTTYKCTNLLTGDVVTSGSGTSGTFTFPTPATNDGIPVGCVFTNTAFVLSLRKTNPPTLVAGQPATYGFTVSNTGSGPAPGATVVDRLPANVAYTSSAGTGWTCTASGAVSAGQLLTCTFAGTISANGSNTALSITATPAKSLSASTVQNKAAVDPYGGTSPVDPSTCTADDNPTGCAVPGSQNVATGVALGLTKSAPSPALVVGYPSDYTLTLTNSGPNDAAGATVTDVLPAGVAYSTATGATCTASGTVSNGQTVTCTVPAATTIAAKGGTASFTVTVAPQTSAGGSTVVNKAAVDPTGGTNPPTVSNCTGTGTPAGCAYAPPAAVAVDVVTGPSPSYTTTVGQAIPSIAVRSGTISSQGEQIGTPTIAVQPANGTASVNADGTLAYTPNAGFSGADPFKYRICNTGNPASCDTETVSITVNNVFTPGAAISTAQNTSVTTPLSGIATTSGKPLDPTRVTSQTTPAHGTISINATTGAVTYTPTAGYTGTDSYSVQVCDTSSPVQCATVTKNVTVGANTVTARNDSATTAPATAVSINVRANDTTTSGQALANPTITTPPGRGTATVNSDGTVTYTPTTGKTGTDTFVYKVCDTSSPTPVCSTATVTVTVPNTVKANDDSASTPQNTAVAVAVLGNDTVSNGGSPLDPSTVTITSVTSHGSTGVNPSSGVVTYTPTGGYSGTDSFSYKVCDTSSPTPVCSSATATVTVGANVVTANNDTASTTPGVAVSTNVRANDTTATGQALAAPTIAGQPPKGTVAVDATTGNIVYTPTNGTSGVDSYRYKVCDTSSPTPVCSTATVTVTVTNTVTAVADSASTPQNTAVAVSVLSNDTVSTNGAPLDPTTVTVTGAPTHGSTSVSAQGVVTYTPNSGYSGNDSFTYRVCDKSTPTATCASATSTISVGMNTVSANADSDSTTPGVAVTTNVLRNDTTSTGQPLGTPTVTGQPAKGSATVNANGTITYSPNNGTSGVDTYTYRICDTSNPNAVCKSADVTITVTNTVTAQDDTASTAQNTAVTTSVLANDTVSTNGAPLNPASVTVTTAPTHGTTQVNSDGTITYAPAQNYSGSDSYRYQVCDRSTPTPTCSTANIAVTVGGNVVTAKDDTATTTAGTSVNTDVRANDTSATGLALTAPTVTTAPGKGLTVVNQDGTITYTPTNGTSGTDTYAYRVCDTSTPNPVCSIATVTVTVTNTVTANADSANTTQNTSVTTDVLANDMVSAKGAPLNPASASVTTAPTHGSTTIDTTTGKITYTPNAGFAGTDSYVYQVCDRSTPTAVCSSATVTVTVGGNTVTANPDSASTTPGVGIGIDVRANDTTSSGQPLANPSVTTGPSHGTTAVTAGSGRIIYTPANGFSGVDGFTYRVCDTSAPTPYCGTATVTVTVVNTVTAKADSSVTPQNTPVTTDVLANDTVSANGAPLNKGSVTVTTAPLHGSTSVDPQTGRITFIPTTGYSGDDSYVYQVCDTSTPTPTCASATVSIGIGAGRVDAVDDTATTGPVTAVTTNVLANDSTSGQPLDPGTVSVSTAAGHGTTSVDPSTGKITYTPDSRFSGVDTYQYTVCDTSTPPACDSATVTVTVTNVLTLTRDTLTVDQNTAAQPTAGSSPVLDNDSAAGAPLDPTSVTVTTGANHGTTTVNPATGAITYTPQQGYSGSDILTYQACDTATPATAKTCGRTTLTITVTPNTVSTQDETASTTPGQAVSTTVHATSRTGQPLANPTVVNGPSKGSAAVNQDGTITYTPTAGTSGADSYVFEVCDTSNPTPVCARGTVRVTVVNTVTAKNDTDTTAQNMSVTTAVLANDTVSTGGSPLDPSTVAVTTQPAHGSVSVNTQNGGVTYTPAAGYSGADSYVYQVCDSSTPAPSTYCGSATVRLTVAVNTVTAKPDTATTAPATAVSTNVRANDTSSSGQTLDAPTVITGPRHGTASVDASGFIVYTPNSGFSGTDVLTYQVCDTGTPAVCDSTTLTVTVLTTVTANDDTASVAQNGSVPVDVLANDTVTTNAAPLNPASVTVTNAAAHGSTSVDTQTGKITYTPNAGYSGTDGFGYQVCDSSSPTAVCATAKLAVTVGANVVTASDDQATTTPGKSVSIDVRANDTSSRNQPLSPPSVISAPGHGSATVATDTGTITYTPNPGFSGTDTFRYRVCDTSTPTPVCSTATVTVSVPSTVTANPDTASTAQNTAVSTPVLANDTISPNGAPLDPGTVVVTTSPTHGSITVDQNSGSITYTPNSGFSGSDSYVYRVCDTSSPTVVCSSATVGVTVGANTVTANADTASTVPGRPVITDVRANDSTSTGQPLATPTIVTAPRSGSVAVASDGTITYTPAAGKSGTDSYAYQVCDTSSPNPVCSQATVTVTVSNTVTATDDAVSTAQNTPALIDELANDSVSPGGAPLDRSSVSVPSASAPANGTVSVGNNGSLTYTPNAGFSGTDRFAYRVCDASSPTPVCGTATVTVSVGTDSVSAADDTASTTPGNPVTVNVRANDSTSTGQPLAAPTITAAPALGTATVNGNGDVVYTPTSGKSGTDQLTYRVCDTSTPDPVCSTATLTVTVSNTVTAVADSDTTAQNISVRTDVLHNDTVATGGAPLDPASVTVTSAPSSGTTDVDTGTGAISYHPASGFTGTDTYVYRVCDTSSPTPQCATAAVIITVGGNTVQAKDDTASTTPASPVTTDVLRNDTSSSGQSFDTPTIIGEPANGSATVNPDGSITYTPADGTSGVDRYTYQVCDTSTPTPACDSATVTVTVTNSVTVKGDRAATAQGVAVTVNVLANDSVGRGGAPLDPGSVIISTSPSNGTATVDSDGQITFQPQGGFSGSDTFGYTVCDMSTPTPVCGSATVTVSVGGNTVVASGDTASTTPGNPVTTNVVANDSTSSGQPLGAPTIAAGPSHGTATVGSDGQITYTPADGFGGSDSYTYEICDTGNPPACDQGTVDVRVVDTVTVGNDPIAVAQNGALNVAILANDSTSPHGPGLDPATVMVSVAPAHGTATLQSDGSIIYTPTPGYSGQDSFGYVVCDKSIPDPVCANGVSAVTITGDTVTAVADTVTTTAGQPVNFDPRSNDTTSTGQALAAPTITTRPTRGTVTVNGDGTVTYTPATGESGSDSFAYRVCDTGTPVVCSTTSATATITVANVVTAVADTASTGRNTAVSTNVLANDTVSTGGAPLDPASVTVITAPTHGSTSVDPRSGAVTYTPTRGFAGSDSYVYQVCDGSSPTPTCASATVSVDVGAGVVTANPDTATTAAGNPVTTDVLANDSSSSGQSLGTPTIVDPPTKGTVAVNADGTITYTPTDHTSGGDSYSYQVCDTGTPAVCSTPAKVSLSVTDVVTARPDSAAVAQNSSTPVAVLANDGASARGAGLDPSSLTVSAAPMHGRAVPDRAAGTIVYTPTPGYSGTDAFTYTVCDRSTPTAVCSSATVQVSVGTDTVTATDDSANTVPGRPVTLVVEDNDTSSTGQSLAAPVVTVAPAKGRAVVNADGSITYTPTDGTGGEDSFTYRVCDTGTPASCATASVTVVVANDVVANPDSVAVPTDGAVPASVLANDTVSTHGPALDPASVTITTQPMHATATVTADGRITYTPESGFSGADSYGYRVCDKSTPTPSCDTTTVAVQVGTGTVTAADDTDSTSPATAVTTAVLRNDSSSTGNPLAAPSISTAPAHGSATVNPDGSVTYKPVDGFSGTDSYAYQVCDTGIPAACATAGVSVDVVNTVTATTDDVSTAPGTAKTIDVLGGDHTSTYGAPLNRASVRILRAAGHGTAVANPDGTVTYTPAAGFVGQDSFTYQVCDTSTPDPVCGEAPVVLNVGTAAVSANDDTASTTPGQPVTTDVEHNDSAGSGTLTPPTIATAPTKGSVVVNTDGTITYTPADGTSGDDSYQYRACTNANPPECSTGTVTLSVHNTVTARDLSIGTAPNTPVTTAVLSGDSVAPHGAPLDPSSVTVTNAPAHGTTSVDPGTGSVTYRPTTGYTGADSYTYRVCDTSTPTPTCSTATVSVTVGGNLVHAGDDRASTTPVTPVTVDVLGNDSSSTGQPLDPASVEVVTQPAHGTVSAADPTTGAITYAPTAGFSGTDTFTYSVCDASAPTPECATATVTLDVVDTVTASNDQAHTATATSVTVAVLDNDRVTTGATPLDPSSVNVVAKPSHGTATVNPSGTIDYLPMTGFTGSDSFTYRVCDKSSPTPQCATAVVTIAVGATTSAVDDVAKTAQNTHVTIDVLGNDLSTAAALDPSSVHVVTAPAHGTTTVDPASGRFRYVPARDYSGKDVFTYRVCDTASPAHCDTASVVVTVAANTVVARDDSSRAPAGSAVVTDVLDNDSTRAGGAALNTSSVTVTTRPGHGSTTVDPATGAITFTPDNGFTGTDTYRYRVCDRSVPTPMCAVATVTVTIAAPVAGSLHLVKSGMLRGGYPASIGSLVSWSMRVTNTGTTTVTDLHVSDPTAGRVTCRRTTLAAGASTSCTVADHTVDSADIGAGQAVNTALASGSGPTGPITSNTAFAAVPMAGIDSAGNHQGHHNGGAGVGSGGLGGTTPGDGSGGTTTGNTNPSSTAYTGVDSRSMLIWALLALLLGCALLVAGRRRRPVHHGMHRATRRTRIDRDRRREG